MGNEECQSLKATMLHELNIIVLVSQEETDDSNKQDRQRRN